MAISTLTQIKKKVRRLTASPDPTQLSDADIEEYIDCFYEQDLPSHLKLWKLRDKYTFFTEPNEDRYTIDTEIYHTTLGPAYVDGNQAVFMQSQEQFYRLYSKQNTEVQGATGNGGTAYTFTVSQVPFLKRQVTVSAVDGTGTQLVGEDDGDGNLISGNSDSTGLSGTVDYVTGVISVSFPQVISSATPVYARVVPYTASRPRNLLFFNNYFEMRPVPDKAYRVEIDVYRRPTQLLDNEGDTPELNQWWQLIAFGAAKKVLEDRQDIDSLQNIMPAFSEQMELALHRTVTQQTKQRVATIYSSQSDYSANQVGYWG